MPPAWGRSGARASARPIIEFAKGGQLRLADVGARRTHQTPSTFLDAPFLMMLLLPRMFLWRRSVGSSHRFLDGAT